VLKKDERRDVEAELVVVAGGQFEHVEEMSPGDTHIVYEQVSPGTGPSYQPIDLADAVGAQLGVTEDIPDRSGKGKDEAYVGRR